MSATSPGQEHDQQSFVVDLQWQCRNRDLCPADHSIRKWAAAAVVTSDGSDNTGIAGEVTIRIVDGPEMQAANARWRDQDKTTNVLSFPAEFPPEAGLQYFGDIMICAEVIQTESVQQGKLPEAHWAHIVVHGMLHLQGYDHIDDAQAAEMELCEVSILQTLGYPDPYKPGANTDTGNIAPGNMTEVEKI